MRDAFGRNIHYLRVSLTEACNLRCQYCRPSPREDSTTGDEPLDLDELFRLCRAFAGLGFDRYRLTGGEPLLREGVPGFVRRLKEISPDIAVGLTTNGAIFAGQARALREAGLDRVNFSLDSLERDVFRRITGVDALPRVMEGIAASLALGFAQVKVNVVVVRGVNHGEIAAIVERFRHDPVYIRFIEYMPFGYNDWLPEKVYPHESILRDLSARFQLEPRGMGGPGPSRDYQVRDARCRVGLISPMTRSFCADCNRLRLTSAGVIRPCLFGAEGVDLGTLLRADASEEALREAILRAVTLKPPSHGLALDSPFPACQGRSMHRIGG